MDCLKDLRKLYPDLPRFEIYKKLLEARNYTHSEIESILEKNKNPRDITCHIVMNEFCKLTGSMPTNDEWLQLYEGILEGIKERKPEI